MMTGDMGGKTYKENSAEALRALHGVALIAVHPVEGIFLGVNEKKKPVFQKINDIADDQAIPTRKNPHELRDASNYASKMLECRFLQVKETNPLQQTTRFGDLSFEHGGYDAQDIVCTEIDGVPCRICAGGKKEERILKAANLIDQFQNATLGRVFPALGAALTPYCDPEKKNDPVITVLLAEELNNKKSPEEIRMAHGVALIAIHPVEGLFLGTDEDGMAIFKKIEELDPNQIVPTQRKGSNGFRKAAAYDSRILECSFHQVKETDPENQRTTLRDFRCEDAINPLKTTSCDTKLIETKKAGGLQVGHCYCDDKPTKGLLKAINLAEKFLIVAFYGTDSVKERAAHYTPCNTNRSPS